MSLWPFSHHTIDIITYFPATNRIYLMKTTKIFHSTNIGWNRQKSRIRSLCSMEIVTAEMKTEKDLPKVNYAWDEINWKCKSHRTCIIEEIRSYKNWKYNRNWNQIQMLSLKRFQEWYGPQKSNQATFPFAIGIFRSVISLIWWMKKRRKKNRFWVKLYLLESIKGLKFESKERKYASIFHCNGVLPSSYESSEELANRKIYWFTYLLFYFGSNLSIKFYAFFICSNLSWVGNIEHQKHTLPRHYTF